jgi:hypothetical protein
MADGEARLVIKLDADIDKLNEKLKKLTVAVDKATGEVKRKFEEQNSHLKKLFGEFKPGEALENVFKRTRLGVFEEGATKIPIFGSALEALGPAGLGAAAGLAAMAIAAEEAHKAIEFAKDIEDSAKKIGVGTTALQEWRLGAEETGGAAKDADAAIHGFSVALGAAQSGLGKRAMKPFEALGFSREDVKAFKSTDEALDAVIQKIAALGSEAQRQAVAEKLGLTPMLGLLRQGTEKIEEMRHEFHELGLVMDREMIEKGSKAAHQYELLAKAVDMDLKNAFISLAPVLVSVAHAIAGLARDLDGVVESFKKIEDRSSQRLEQMAEVARADQRRLISQGVSRIARGGSGKLNPWEQSKFDKDQEVISEANGIVGMRQWRDKAAEAKPDGPQLKDVSATKAATNKAAEQAKHFNDELARIREATLRAEDHEGKTVEERVAIADKLLEQERKAALTHIKDQVKTKQITAAQGELLRFATQFEFMAKASAQSYADRKRVDDKQTELINSLTESTVQELRARAAIARTQEERRALSLLVLKIEQEAARQALERRIQFDPDLQANPSTANQLRADLKGKQASDMKGFQRDNLDPLQSYFDKAPKTLEELNDKAREFAADGLAGLNRELVQGKKAADLARNALREFFLKMAEQALISAEASAFGKGGAMQAVGHFLGFFAEGGDPPIGRPSVVGEKGPELFVPKTAGTIIPNKALARLSGMRSSAPPVFAPNFDLRGAVVTEDLLRQMDSMARGHANRAGAQAYARSVSTFSAAAPGRNASFAKLGT